MTRLQPGATLGAALLGAAVSLLPAPTAAQLAEDVPPRIFVGGSLMLSSPTGEFAENVGLGFGIGGFARFAVDELGIASFRLDLGFMNYGNETTRICVTQPCFVTGEIDTSNNIVYGGIGPELGIGTGAVRMYAGASVGFAYFATTSSVKGDNNDEPFASSDNFSDGTFAWTAGGGGQFRVSRGQTPVWLDLGARYHGNGEARYLRKGDIVGNEDGSVTITPRQSDTNLWTFQIGVSVGLRPGAGGL